MKTLIILLLIPLAFACTSVNSSALVNSAMTLNQGDCIFIEDMNTTIGSTDLRLNNSVNLTAPGIIVNSGTNTTYRCNFDVIGLNETLPFGGVYSDPNHQVIISAPAFPKINRIMTLRGGDIASEDFADYNLTVNCLQRPYDSNISLGFNQSYSNNETNETFTCPAYPMLNISRPLGWGETFNNSALNLSLQGAPYPILSINQTLKCGAAFSQPNMSLYIAAPSCINMDKHFNFSESVSFPDYNASFTAPDKLNQNLVLSDGQNYSNDSAGITVACKTTTQQYADYCSNVSTSNLTAIWQFMNVSDNQTYNNYATVGIDNLTDLCTPQEKFGGAGRLIQCVNRIALATSSQCNQTADDLKKCTSAAAQDSLDKQNGATTSDNVLGLAGFLFGGFFFICCLALGGYYYINKKFRQQGETR